MPQNEREELIFDIASEQLKRTSKAGVWAFALDRVSDILSTKSDEELLTMLPPKKKKKKETNKQPKGF